MSDIFLTQTSAPEFVGLATSRFTIQPAQAELSDNRQVLVWAQNDVDQKDIIAAFLDEQGALLGEPFRVNTTLLSDQIQPEVIALDTGGFAVIWMSFGQDDFVPPNAFNRNEITQQYGIYQQVFDDLGQPVGSETLVNTAVVDGQQEILKTLQLPDGGYCVIFVNSNFLTSQNRGYETYLQRFDASGDPVGANVPLPEGLREGNSYFEDFAVLANGEILATWGGPDGNLPPNGLAGISFDLDGEETNRFLISDQQRGSYAYLQVLDDGNILALLNMGVEVYDDAPYAVHLTPTGEELGRITDTLGIMGQFTAVMDVALLPDGNVLLVTVTRIGDVWNELQAIVLAPDGKPLTGQQQLSLPDAEVSDVSLSVLDDGRISLTYQADFSEFSRLATRVFEINLDPDAVTLTDASNAFDATADTAVWLEALGGHDDLLGSAFGDTILGGSGNDEIFGNAGNDNIYGEGWEDTLYGGAGEDFIDGGVGNDTLNGGDDRDVLDGGGGDDVVYGDDGDDLIYSNRGSDTLYGGDGNDLISIGVGYRTTYSPDVEIHGGAGDDFIRVNGSGHSAYGDAGADYFEITTFGLDIDGSNGNYFGGADDDTFVMTSYAMAFGLDGGEGIDTAVLGGNVVVDMAQEFWMTNSPRDTSQQDFKNIEILSLERYLLYDIGLAIWEITGSDQDDTIFHEVGTLTATLGDGDDLVVSDFTAEFERTEFIPSDVSVSLGDGEDFVQGGTSFNVFDGGSGRDTLIGGYLDDSLTGGAGDDLLIGGVGFDVFSGGAGDDVMDGGADQDFIRLSGSAADYALEATLDGLLVSGPDGSDLIQNIEVALFEDGSKAEISAAGFEEIVARTLIESPKEYSLFSSEFELPVETFESLGSDLTYSMTYANGDPLDGLQVEYLSFSNRIEVNNWLLHGSEVEMRVTASNGIESISQNLLLLKKPETAGASDFDGNGHDDLLFYNSNTGRVGQISMPDSTWQGIGRAGSGWDAVATGLFDTDDYSTDILWHNRATGVVGRFDLENGKFEGWNTIGQAGAGWEVAGVGDFNADDQVDILWENASTGKVGQFRMDAGNASWSQIGQSGAHWRIAGVGEISGDRRDDILWQNEQTNALGWYEIGDTGATWHNAVKLGQGYDVLGLADLDADGQGSEKILVHNAETGVVGVFDGFYQFDDFYWRKLGVTGDGWSFEALGDFDGDGFDDVLWRHDDDGRLGMFDMASNYTYTWQSLGVAGGDWDIVL